MRHYSFMQSQRPCFLCKDWDYISIIQICVNIYPKIKFGIPVHQLQTKSKDSCIKGIFTNAWRLKQPCLLIDLPLYLLLTWLALALLDPATVKRD